MASVSDQADAALEHLLVLKGGAQVCLPVPAAQRVLPQMAQMSGLYGALNQGFAAAQGEIFSWLNDDEQYLPGTLAFVRRYFEAHPRVDLLFGDFLVVDASGQLLSFRKGAAPRWPYILSGHLYLLSCSMFFRRRVWEFGLRFDPTFQSAGDMDFVARVLRAGFRAAHVPRYMATFTWTGDNLSAGDAGRAEERNIRAAAPAWVRWLRGPLQLARLVEKAWRGAYRQSWPLAYEIYLDNPMERTSVAAPAGSWHWPQRKMIAEK